MYSCYSDQLRHMIPGVVIATGGVKAASVAKCGAVDVTTTGLRVPKPDNITKQLPQVDGYKCVAMAM